ncbi:MAG: MFS transporter [Candidatus Hydrothermota bacterium]|nr:MAG: MFS transporter [Candidatus Hydrothermae bacterium]
MEKKKLPGSVIGFGFVSFFTDMSSEMVYPLLPIFLSSVLGVGAEALGLIEGIAEATASVLKTFSGYISDRIRRRKPLVLLGYSLSAIAKPTIGLAGRWIHVLAARFADRVGKGIRTSPRDSLIADVVDDTIRGRAFGFHRAMDTGGAVFGPLLAYILLAILLKYYSVSVSVRSVFLLSLIPGIFAIITLIFFVKEKPKEQRELRKLKLGFKGLSKEFKLLLAVMLVFSLGNSSNTFLILRASNIGFKTEMIPILYMFFNIVYAGSAMPLGSLSDKIGRRLTIAMGFFIYFIVYLGFARLSTHQYIYLWILFGLYGIYYGFTDGTLRALVADISRREERGFAYGLYHMLVGLMLFPASFIAGILWEKVAPSAPFYFGALTAAISAFLILIVIKEKKYEEDPVR